MGRSVVTMVETPLASVARLRTILAMDLSIRGSKRPELP